MAGKGKPGPPPSNQWRMMVRRVGREMMADPAHDPESGHIPIRRNKLYWVARRMYDAAINDGDMAAIREIGDRHDGKPVALLEGDGEGATALVIRRVFVGADGAESLTIDGDATEVVEPAPLPKPDKE